MSDRHERFIAWLVGGAENEPARDLALHASGCDGCMRAVAILDLLAAIDVGVAPPPPHRIAAAARPRPLHGARVAITGAAVVVLAASIAIVASGQLRNPQDAADAPHASVAEGVLGGTPTGDLEPEPTSDEPSSPTGRATPSPSTSDELSAQPSAAGLETVTPRTPTSRTPTPPTPAPTLGQPSPTPSATPSAIATATASATSIPTAPPTPTALPTPTPTPEPSSPAPSSPTP